MIRYCLKCEKEIPIKRLLAMPDTQLCLPCKTKSDEPLLNARSVRTSRVLVETSLSDLAEMSKEAREMVSGS